MTTEQVEARKAQLVEHLQQILERMHELRGAVLECDHWLQELNASKTED